MSVCDPLPARGREDWGGWWSCSTNNLNESSVLKGGPSPGRNHECEITASDALIFRLFLSPKWSHKTYAAAESVDDFSREQPSYYCNATLDPLGELLICNRFACGRSECIITALSCSALDTQAFPRATYVTTARTKYKYKSKHKDESIQKLTVESPPHISLLLSSPGGGG